MSRHKQGNRLILTRKNHKIFYKREWWLVAGGMELLDGREKKDCPLGRICPYKEQQDSEYAGLVKIVAGRLGMYLGYTVEYDDLVGYGIFGLIDAIDKFELSKGVKFETYASLRIRGAIIDQIRKMDWIPRTIRQKQKKIETAMQELERELGRTPNSEELAEYLEVTVEEVEQMISQANLSSLISLDEYLEQGSDVYTEPSGRPRFDQPEQVSSQNTSQ